MRLLSFSLFFYVADPSAVSMNFSSTTLLGTLIVGIFLVTDLTKSLALLILRRFAKLKSRVVRNYLNIVVSQSAVDMD